MNYKPRLNAINTPSRKLRKSSRTSTFLANRNAKKTQKKQARLARVAQ